MPTVRNLMRMLSGGLIFISGLMMLGLFGWETPIAGPEARPFQSAMHDAGYFLPIITAIFLIAGACSALNVYGAVSALALLPVSVNIVLFHSVLEAGQLPLAIGFFAINCYLLWYYRTQYRSLFYLKPKP